jgi:hypothetical protein
LNVNTLTIVGFKSVRRFVSGYRQTYAFVGNNPSYLTGFQIIARQSIPGYAIENYAPATLIEIMFHCHAPTQLILKAVVR